MATKSELLEIIEVYKDQIAFLKGQVQEIKDEKDELRAQVEKLQDAIINVRAPEAYKDLMYDKHVQQSDLDPEEIEKQKKTLEIEKLYLQDIESPTFRSGEDIELLLMSGMIKGATQSQDTSIHGNDES